MKIKPLGKRVLISLIEEEKKTLGGIIIPRTEDKENSNIGQVVAVGNNSELKEIEIGQKVVYLKDSGSEIKDGEKKYLILDIEDILAIVE